MQENKNLTGVLNNATLNPITSSSFMQKFIKLMNMTFEISTPKWLLEIGAIIVKTETKLFLKCSYVVPK